jgi:hypothetical protein
MKPAHARTSATLAGVLILGVPAMAADKAEMVRAGDTGDTVATAVYSRVDRSYKRAKANDGSFKPEYYALSNGGRIYGTASDITVDRVTYAQVAEIAMKVLALQNYRYAQTKEQAKLLLVLNWGSTIAPNGMHQQQNVASLRDALSSLQTAQIALNEIEPATYEGQDVAKNATAGFSRHPSFAKTEELVVVHAAGSVEAGYLRSLVDDRVRDELNTRNARVIGYLDDLADANDIRRHAGGGDRYNDLITDVEESRYYIVVSAYDFKELTEKKQQKLLWQTRVSVRAPGNTFNETYLAMLKSASRYFGQNSGRLVRGEESRGQVELGELKYLSEAREPAKSKEDRK